MYYRRKLVLALIEVAGGHLDRLKLQKLLFLVAREQPVPAYSFVPYRYGCYSFQAHADLMALQAADHLVEEKHAWKLRGIGRWRDLLRPADQSAIDHVLTQYGSWPVDDLMRDTYLRFPWYALNSQIKERLLTSEELSAIESLRPNTPEPTLFTIGYEGLSLDAYLNHLLQQGIRLLCDVRNRPYSMKYGFSLSTLRNACQNIGLTYVHLPALGIPGAQRQNLHEAGARDRLLARYRDRLAEQGPELQHLKGLCCEYGRAALMCFEQRPHDCHRSVLAEELAMRTNCSLPVIHL